VIRRSEGTTDLTGLLQAWDRGETGALDELAPLLQAELRGLARGILARERPANGWQATELVHEAYLRLLGWRKGVRWQNRAHDDGRDDATCARGCGANATCGQARRRGRAAVARRIDVAAPQCHRRGGGG
jgi:hypothetical protein